MPAERCDECGFDGDDWSDAAAVDAVGGLPGKWTQALSGVTSDERQRRPWADRWSIAEYTDHVREVLFGMRFLLDTAVTRPGADLGPPPPSRFDPEARLVDVDGALAGIDREAALLCAALSGLSAADWSATVTMGGDSRDPHWIVRHALHDATHHLVDVERLRAAM